MNSDNQIGSMILLGGSFGSPLLRKPKIFKRDGKWQLCYPLPTNSSNLELSDLAYYYCDRMNAKECHTVSIDERIMTNSDILSELTFKLASGESLRYNRDLL